MTDLSRAEVQPQKSVDTGEDAALARLQSDSLSSPPPSGNEACVRAEIQKQAFFSPRQGDGYWSIAAENLGLSGARGQGKNALIAKEMTRIAELNGNKPVRLGVPVRVLSEADVESRVASALKPETKPAVPDAEPAALASAPESANAARTAADVDRQQKTRLIADNWKSDSRALLKTDLGLSASGQYKTKFGDSMSGIALRSLRADGVSHPSRSQLFLETGRLVALNADKYPELVKNPAAIKPDMVIQVSEPVQARVEPAPVGHTPEVILPANADPTLLDEPVPASAVVESRAAEAENKPKFHGLDIGLLKIGVTSDGSLNLGANIGIARLDTKLGLDNRVTFGAGAGDVGAGFDVGAGVNKRGLYADASTGAKVGPLAGADVGAGARLGPHTGVDGKAGAYVGPLKAGADTGLSATEEGLKLHAAGDAGIPEVLGAGADAHFKLDEDSSLGAGADAKISPAKIGPRVGIATDGNTVIRPEVGLAASDDRESGRIGLDAQVGPKFDLTVGAGRENINHALGTVDSGRAELGIGQSGVGARTFSFNSDNGKPVVRRYWLPSEDRH